MVDRQEILDILTNDVNIVNNVSENIMATKNGMLDELHVEVNRGICVAEALYGLNNMVNIKQGYPKNNQSAVTFTADMVVMDGRDYRRLLELLEN